MSPWAPQRRAGASAYQSRDNQQWHGDGKGLRDVSRAFFHDPHLTRAGSRAECCGNIVRSRSLRDVTLVLSNGFVHNAVQPIDRRFFT
jgi:hypothetical protein